MRRPVLVSLIAAIALLLVATFMLYQKYSATSSDLVASKNSEQTMQTRYADAVNAIAEIQDSLNAMPLGPNGTPLTPLSLQSERNISGANRHEALERIAIVNAGIERAKTRISQLEHQLKVSGVKVSGLQKMIANLKAGVADREQQVAVLTGRVDSLQTQVSGLQTTVQQDKDTLMVRDQVLEDRRKELGTIYYVAGNKRTLEKDGLVIPKGGVLGLGRTLTLTGKYDESMLTAVDTDQETTIRVPGTKVRVLSPQPAGSYELRVVGNETEIHILDPQQFRKVKHLIVLTA